MMFPLSSAALSTTRTNRSVPGIPGWRLPSSRENDGAEMEYKGAEYILQTCQTSIMRLRSVHQEDWDELYVAHARVVEAKAKRDRLVENANAGKQHAFGNLTEIDLLGAVTSMQGMTLSEAETLEEAKTKDIQWYINSVQSYNGSKSDAAHEAILIRLEEAAYWLGGDSITGPQIAKMLGWADLSCLVEIKKHFLQFSLPSRLSFTLPLGSVS